LRQSVLPVLALPLPDRKTGTVRSIVPAKLTGSTTVRALLQQAYSVPNPLRLAGMAQVGISAFPTLKRVTWETPSTPPQAKLGRGWVGALKLSKNLPKAFVRKAFRPGLD
jgi:hypothetical protein